MLFTALPVICDCFHHCFFLIVPLDTLLHILGNVKCYFVFKPLDENVVCRTVWRLDTSDILEINDDVELPDA